MTTYEYVVYVSMGSVGVWLPTLRTCIARHSKNIIYHIYHIVYLILLFYDSFTYIYQLTIYYHYIVLSIVIIKDGIVWKEERSANTLTSGISKLLR